MKWVRMSGRKQESSQDVCLQSLILRRKFLTLASLIIVILTIAFEVSIYDQAAYQAVQEPEVRDLVNFGLQRQLFWGVVSLSSFIGYFQFLAVVDRRKSFSWLYMLIFFGFVFIQTISVSRVAISMKWVAILEQQWRIPVESTFLLYFIPGWLIFLLLGVCLILWLIYLCLFIERTTRSH